MRDDGKKRRKPAAPATVEAEPTFAALHEESNAIQAVAYQNIMDRRTQDRIRLRLDRETMLAYIDLMRRREDWHGVADAAADLREIDARLAVLR